MRPGGLAGVTGGTGGGGSVRGVTGKAPSPSLPSLRADGLAATVSVRVGRQADTAGGPLGISGGPATDVACRGRRGRTRPPGPPTGTTAGLVDGRRAVARGRTQGRHEGPGSSSGALPDADRALAWLHGEVRTPRFSNEARREVGYLSRLPRLLQRGETPSLPRSRPISSIGPGRHELRVTDRNETWRVVYWLNADAVYVLDVFAKMQATPDEVKRRCRQRLRHLQQTLEG